MAARKPAAKTPSTPRQTSLGVPGSSAVALARRLALPLLLAAVATRCGATYGCTSCESPVVYPEPPPPGGALLYDAVAGQVQERAVVFFAQHLSEVLRAYLEVRTVAG